MNSGRVRFENIPFPSNEISGSVWSKRKSTKLTKFSLGKLRVDLCFSLPPFPYAHTKISPIFTTLPHRSTLLRYSNLSLSICLVLLLKYCFNFILLLLSFWKTLSRFFFLSFISVSSCRFFFFLILFLLTFCGTLNCGLRSHRKSFGVRFFSSPSIKSTALYFVNFI